MSDTKINKVFEFIELNNKTLFRQLEEKDKHIYNLEIENIRLNKKYNKLIQSHEKFQIDYLSLQDYCEVLRNTNATIIEKCKNISIWDYIKIWEFY
jgi:hypothetical protein